MLDPVVQPIIPRRPKKQSQIRPSEDLDEDSSDKLVYETKDEHLNTLETKSGDEDEKVPIIPKRPERKKTEYTDINTPVIPRRPGKSLTTNVDTLNTKEMADTDKESEMHRYPNEDPKLLHDDPENAIEHPESNKVDSGLEKNSLIDSERNRSLDKLLENEASVPSKDDPCSNFEESLKSDLTEENKTHSPKAKSGDTPNPSLQSQQDNESITDNLSEKLSNDLNIEAKEDKYNSSTKNILETEFGDISPESKTSNEEDGSREKKIVQKVDLNDTSKDISNSKILERENNEDINNALNCSNEEGQLQIENEVVDQSSSEKEIESNHKNSDINTSEDNEHSKNIPQIPRRPKTVKPVSKESNSILTLEDISHKENQESNDIDRKNSDANNPPLTLKHDTDKAEPMGQEKLASKPIAPPKPKKLSSKIAAFQQMFNQETLPLKGGPGPITFSNSGPNLKTSENKEVRSKLSNDKIKFAESLQGVMGKGIALPGMVNPNINQNISDKTEEPETGGDVKMLNVKKGIAKGPRGKRLPKSLKTPVNIEVTPRFNSTVLTIWELNFQLDKDSITKSLPESTENQSEDEKTEVKSSEPILNNTDDQVDEKDDNVIKLSFKAGNISSIALENEEAISNLDNVAPSVKVNEEDTVEETADIENLGGTLKSTTPEGEKDCFSQTLELPDTDLKYIEDSQAEEEHAKM